MKNFNNNFKTKISNKNVNYTSALKLMQKKVEGILNHNEDDLVWLLNHDHIYTCGTSANKKEIINITNTQIIQTNRGGKTTYHGPGQRVIYLMINLNKRKKDIRQFIDLLAQSVISLLLDLNIESTTIPDRVGVWITKSNGKILEKEKKIAAIGLRIKKWVTYHGLSFNINPDLKYYKNIHACGIENYSTTSLNELGIKISQKKFDVMFLNYFKKGLKNF